MPLSVVLVQSLKDHTLGVKSIFSLWWRKVRRILEPRRLFHPVTALMVLTILLGPSKLYAQAAPQMIRFLQSTIASPSGNSVSVQVTASWDANDPSDNVTGYILKVGTAPGDYSQTIDVGNVTSYMTSVQIGIRYYFAVLAYSLAGQSPLSAEVSYLPTQEARCLPGGTQAVAINPTKFVKTGFGGAGDLAEVYFLIQSVPPVTYLSLKANGLEFADSVMDITGATAATANLKPSLGLRFRMPPTSGTYPISVFAKNNVGCFTEKLSAYSFTIK